MPGSGEPGTAVQYSCHKPDIQGISLSLTAGESLALVNGERKEIETRVRGKDGIFTQVPMPAVEYHGGISAAILFFGEVWGLEFQVLDGEIIVAP